MSGFQYRGGAPGTLSVQNLTVEAALGNIPGLYTVQKFGRAPDGVQDVATDIWDVASGSIVPNNWTAPTQARAHSIVSTDAADDSNGGAGARLIQVYGLPDWDTKETSEIVALDGTTPVNTSGSYAIIHRMKVLTKGATNVNVGLIAATPVGDSKVTPTAQINAGQGQTQMAIYGIPSTQKAIMYDYYASMLSGGGGATIGVDVNLLFNPEPDAELTNFLVKHTNAMFGAGNTILHHHFNPPNIYSGPGIFKIQCTATADDVDVSAGFGLLLFDI